MKNDTFTLIWLFILVSILVALSIWGIFYISDETQKISIFGIVTVIVAAFTSVLTVNINNSRARDREYELHVLKEKQKVCEHYYNVYFEILREIKKGNNGQTKKALDELMLFKKGLMNWGSEDLIQKYLEYEINNSKYMSNTIKMVENGNNFLKEIRKELGFSDSRNLNVMGLILTDEARKELIEEEL